MRASFEGSVSGNCGSGKLHLKRKATTPCVLISHGMPWTHHGIHWQHGSVLPERIGQPGAPAVAKHEVVRWIDNVSRKVNAHVVSWMASSHLSTLRNTPFASFVCGGNATWTATASEKPTDDERCDAWDSSILQGSASNVMLRPAKRN